MYQRQNAIRRRRSHKNVYSTKKASMKLGKLVLILLWVLAAFFMGRAVGKAEKYYETAEYQMEQFAQRGLEGDLDGGGAEALILVNKENPLPDDYDVELVTLPDGVHKGALQAYESLCEMLDAGRREGLAFEVCSAYRDSERQRQLFEEDVIALMVRGYSYEKAYEEVARETMPPGCSEHSTGLAFDIVALDYQMLDAGQENTEENIWLREHCAEYGFILRYPKDKEDITQISYESWHFRYVGEKAAREIMESGVTLEEYLENL